MRVVGSKIYIERGRVNGSICLRVEVVNEFVHRSIFLLIVPKARQKEE